MSFYGIIGLVLFVICFLLSLKVYYDHKGKKTYTNFTKFIVRVAIFGAISTVLYVVPFFKFPIPIFPSFLEFHFDEIPAFIAGFAYGPLSAVGVIVVKTIIKLPFTTTLTVGEISDLLFSTAFIVPAALIYKHHRKFSGALIGLLVGTVFQMIIAVVGNIYIMIPFYGAVFGLSEESILYLCRLANPNITNVGWSYGLMAVLPFNAIKDGIVIVVTILVYKSMHRFIDRLQSN